MRALKMIEWLQQFDPDTEIKPVMNTYYGKVELVAIQDGEELQTLEVTEDA